MRNSYIRPIIFEGGIRDTIGDSTFVRSYRIIINARNVECAMSRPAPRPLPTHIRSTRVTSRRANTRNAAPLMAQE